MPLSIARLNGTERAPSVRSLRFTLVLVMLITAVMSSLGAPLIPAIAQSSGVSLSVANWLSTVTLLTSALSTPIMGRLADGPHQRRIILVALTFVLVGLIMAATTDVFSILLTGRAFQGLGLGLMPVTMAIARRHLPAQEAGRTIGTLSVTAITGIGLGYPLTGILAEIWDYHAAFWAGTAIAAVTLAVAIAFLPGSSVAESRPFDLLGACLLCIAVTSLIIVLSEAARWGWLSAPVIGLFTASAVLTAIWTWHELRTTDPLIDLRQTRHRLVLTSYLAGFTMSIAMFLFIPMIVEFAQLPTSTGYGLGASIIVGGCALIPLSVGSILARQIAPSFVRRFGHRALIPFGSLLFAVAMVGFAVEHTHLWNAFGALGIGGLGAGFSYAAMPGFIVRSVRPAQTGSAMGVYQVLRSIASAAGSALSVLILASFTGDRAGTEPPVTAFVVALLIGAAICILTAVFSYFLPGRDNAPVHLADETIKESGERGVAGFRLDDPALVSDPSTR